jgi:CMP/dCMP kinase
VSARTLVIAVDGPAGAGKSSASRALARRLGIPYLDTGATYRAVALAALAAGVRVPLDDEERAAAGAIARELPLAFADGGRVLLGGRDVTEAIRAPEVSRASSEISAIPEVRRAMVELQRRLAAGSGGVVEGRDIGTVVFPDAPLKVFITAAPEERARRRLAELRSRGVDATWEEVLADQEERDRRDSSREDSPLRPAAGAIILDTSELSLEEVVDRLAELARKAATRL